MKITANAILSAPCSKTLSFEYDQRIFVVGDLDGDCRRLQKALDGVGFISQQDTLICLGDLIDRGAETEAVIAYLKEIGAHTVLGNHEQLMIESVMCENKETERIWLQNGGAWHRTVNTSHLVEICEWLITNPLSIIVEYKGAKVGISHTIPQEWNWEQFPSSKIETVSALLWDRNVVKKRKSVANIGVDFSIHGHNTTQVPFWISNTYHIDTSYYGRLSVLELSKVIEKFNRLNTPHDSNNV